MKIEMKARKLEDVDVSFVSLVKRGANMIPFRIMKSEKEQGMNLDLGALFTTKKAAAPEVAAFVVNKDSVTTELVTKMEDKGLVQQEPMEGDTTVIFKSEDYSEDSAIVQLNKECAVVLTTVKKSFYSYPEGNNFNDNLAKNTFFPSVDMAQDVLEDTIANIMYDGSVHIRDKAGMLESAIEAFKQYVSSLVTKLPASAFEMAQYTLIEPESSGTEVKVEVAVEKAEGELEPEVIAVSESSEAEAIVKADDSNDTKVEDTDPTDVIKKSSDEPSATDDKPAEVSMKKHQGTIEGLDDEPVVAVEKSEPLVAVEDSVETVAHLAKMALAIESLTQTVDSIAKNNQTLGERLTKAEGLADSAINSLNSTVLTGSEEDVSGEVVKKAETPVDLYAGTALDLLG